MGVEGADAMEPPRERGWGRIVLVLLTLAILPATPLLHIVVPVGDPLLLVAPVMAAMAAAGWRRGGRGGLVVLWVAAAGWILWRASHRGTAFADLILGWAVLLAVTYGGSLAVGPGGTRFLPRALVALAGAMVLGALLIAVVPGGWSGAVALVGEEVGRRAVTVTREWQAVTSTPEWLELVGQVPAWEGSQQMVEAQLAAAPGPARQLFLAILALQSVVAMAVAWAIYHRVATVRLGPPLAGLREVRYPDALVWGMVVGLALLALPGSGPLRTAGLDLTLFFGALYVLRGVGVMVWFLRPGRWMKVVLVVLTLFLWPLLAGVALALGLSDTWFDWRRATRRDSQRSE